MYRIMFLFVSLVLASCASGPNEDEKVTVTGTRISKDEAKKIKLTPVGNIGDLLRTQLNGIPQIKDGMTCKELLKELDERGIEVKSIKDTEVLAETSDNKQIKYMFNEGGCN